MNLISVCLYLIMWYGSLFILQVIGHLMSAVVKICTSDISRGVTWMYCFVLCEVCVKFVRFVFCIVLCEVEDHE